MSRDCKLWVDLDLLVQLSRSVKIKGESAELLLHNPILNFKKFAHSNQKINKYN